MGDQELGEVTQRVRILAGMNTKFKSLPASHKKWAWSEGSKSSF